MKGKSYVMSGVLILSFVGGLWLTAANWSALPPKALSPVATVPPSAPIAALTSIPARAQVVPLREASLALPIGGEVLHVLVEEGQEVAAGDLLLELAAEDLEIEERLAQIAVLQAEADLDRARALVSLAQVSLDEAALEASAASRAIELAEAGPTEAQLALQAALIAAADAQIARAVAGQALIYEQAAPGDLATAQAELSVAQAELLITRMTNEPLVQSETTPPGERELAQMRLNAAQAEVVAAEAWLAELQAGPTVSKQQEASASIAYAASEREVSMAELALLLAGGGPRAFALLQANLQAANSAVVEAEVELQRSQGVVAHAEARLEEARTALALAGTAIGKARLVAPFAGTIAQVTVKEGEVANAGIPVMILADLKELRLETVDMTQMDIVKVQPGASVTVTFDALAPLTYRGQVASIAATASDDHGEMDYAVIIALTESNLPIRWGMTAAVAIKEGGPES